MEENIQLINDLIIKASIHKITLSKPRQKSATLRNVYFRPVILKAKSGYKATLRFKTEDVTKNCTPEELLTAIKIYLVEDFYNIDIITDTEQISIMQNKKGNSHVSRKKVRSEKEVNLSHDNKKYRLISEDRPYLADLDIVSSTGKVYGHAQKKYKQINKFVEIIDALIDAKDLEQSFRITDMGCGKGYLSFALFDHINSLSPGKVSLTGIEIREDLIHKCNSISKKYKMTGLQFQEGNIEDAEIGKVDMVIALHACDIATDMAIAKGIAADAKYIVVAPCCHKQIRKEMSSSPLLQPILRHGIMMERQAEMITDGIRALYMEAHGYKTKAFEFISSEHTGKNVMITAVKSKVNKEALAQINAIKENFGIEEHYLETLL